ncbi:conserved phage C-terminal domain-containing protein [Acetobacterium bakii]|uniref:conserved phage C-terminal domain-containing protein n=1 Tax=Acetobacterium bakii TaxID=52689 RepID=UPI0006836E33|nr:conserved phage C-terminal domain-containing protein [Acetobacterium bakii]
MAKQGWISLHRSIQDHWVWDEKPFDKRSAWIDILLMANHQDNKFLLGNQLVEVSAGSFITSDLKLMDRWGWGRSKVRSFLEVLEKDEMIIKKSDTKKTTIGVVKYKEFQGFKGIQSTTEKQPANNDQTAIKQQTNSDQTASVQRSNTNNNVNNANTVNNVNTENNENKKQPAVCSAVSIEIINYLNGVLGTNYKPTAKATQALIKARLSEKYTIDDFKQVIDIKNAEWQNDPKMSKFLRPETLFGNKFESYLNQMASSPHSNLPQNLQNAFKLAEIENNKPKELTIFDKK